MRVSVYVGGGDIYSSIIYTNANRIHFNTLIGISKCRILGFIFLKICVIYVEILNTKDAIILLSDEM